MCDFIFVRFHLLAIHFHFGLRASMALADTPCSQICGRGLALGLCRGECSISMSSGPVEPEGRVVHFYDGGDHVRPFSQTPKYVDKIFP